MTDYKKSNAPATTITHDIKRLDVGAELPLDRLGHVSTDPATALGLAFPVNPAPRHRALSCDCTNF